eukprot:g3991.t1
MEQAAVLIHHYNDVYAQLAAPGGVPCTGFIDLYSDFTSAGERNLKGAAEDNELPAASKCRVALSSTGVAPADGDDDKELLRAAVAEHGDNFDLRAAIRNPSNLFMDSVLTKSRNCGGGGGGNEDEEEEEEEEYTHVTVNYDEAMMARIKQSGAHVYNIAGWYDSGSVRAAQRLHEYLGPTQSKMTLGPWSHGVRGSWTPGAQNTTPDFSLYEEVKRYLDCKLKDDCTRLPAGLCSGGSLTGRSAYSGYHLVPKDPHRGVSYCADALPPVDVVVNQSTTTGKISRWNLVQHLMKKPVTYPDRAAQIASSPQSGLVSFALLPDNRACARPAAGAGAAAAAAAGAAADSSSRGSPLLHGIEQLSICGSAHVDIDMELPLDRDPAANDAVIFAYLDEEMADGTIHYITEGQVQCAGHLGSSSSSSSSSSRFRTGKKV